MNDDDEDEIDYADHELFDISDVEFDFQRTKNLCKVYFILKSETPINALRFYLAVKAYVEQMEAELGIMQEVPDKH